MRGETRRKARRRYPADEALRRVSPRRRRERRRGERERGRDPEHRAELDQRCHARPRFGSVAERTEAGGGELRSTRPRRRICIRRAGRRTRKSPALHREYRYPNRGRTLTGKPARHSNSPCHMHIALHNKTASTNQTHTPNHPAPGSMEKINQPIPLNGFTAFIPQ